MPDTTDTPTPPPVDPHADCGQAAVWNGIEWECRAHSPPVVVPRVREKYIAPRDAMAAQMAHLAGGRPAPTASTTVPRTRDNMQADLAAVLADNVRISGEIAAVQTQNAELAAQVASTIAELAVIKTELAKRS